MADTLARRLARFASELRYENLPPHVLDKARACLLHNLGVGLAGHGSGAAAKARAAVLVNGPTDAGGRGSWSRGEQPPLAPRRS